MRYNSVCTDVTCHRENKMKYWFIIILLTGCSRITNSDNYYIETEDKLGKVNDIQEVIEQVSRTFRKSDKRLIAELTKVYNHNDDYKVLLTTGLKKENGLSNYLLDSIFYDSRGNDTLKINYVHRNSTWLKNQVYIKRFRPDNQISYFKTERFNDKNRFLKEIFYTYTNHSKLESETEFECSVIVSCDSLYKKVYYYDTVNKFDSTASFFWRDKNWTRIKRKNGK
jgi:hypothetical protein